MRLENMRIRRNKSKYTNKQINVNRLNFLNPKRMLRQEKDTKFKRTKNISTLKFVNHCIVHLKFI